MRLVRWLLLLILLVVLVLFGLSNREQAAVRLWPFDLAWVAPLSVIVLSIAALTFLLGAGIVWAASLRYRRRARRMQEAARLLEAELAQYRAREAKEVGPVPPPPTNLARLQRPAA